MHLLASSLTPLVLILVLIVFSVADLDPHTQSRLEGGGRAGSVPSAGRGHADLSRHRSSSLEDREKEIREKGSEILREQLDAAKKVAQDSLRGDASKFCIN